MLAVSDEEPGHIVNSVGYLCVGFVFLAKRLRAGLGPNHGLPAHTDARKRRLEGRIFQAGYRMFRWAHRILVGLPVRIGNFSVLSFEQVSALVVSPDLWSHYAATVLKLRIPRTTLPIDRGRRLMGRSRMNYVALVIHGRSAFSVFSEIVATRVLIGGSVGFVLVSAIFVALLAFHAFGRVGPGNWTLAAFVLVFLMVTNAVIMALFPPWVCLRGAISLVFFRSGTPLISSVSVIHCMIQQHSKAVRAPTQPAKLDHYN